MADRRSKYRNVAALIALALLALLAAASLLPLVEANIWWIRFMDFPRLQLAIAMSAVLGLYLGLRGRPAAAEWIVLIGAVGALSYQVYKLHPYSGLVEHAVIAQPDCREGQRLRIMVANVKQKNETSEAFLNQVAAVDPDLLLVMETDAWWDERLQSLHDAFPHQTQSIPDDGFYGMHLFSKLELMAPEFRFFFGTDTPTVVSLVRLRGGDTIRFIGLHPKPPLAWSNPTTMRDAHILQAALMARASDTPTIVAGDFNAVPWERVTRRAIRIGSLLDPRVGRGVFPTYDAQSYLISWPLDQILVQQQLTLQGFERLSDFGSDHLAVVATLCHEPTAAQEAPALHANDLAEAETAIDNATELQKARQ